MSNVGIGIGIGADFFSENETFFSTFFKFSHVLVSVLDLNQISGFGHKLINRDQIMPIPT